MHDYAMRQIYLLNYILYLPPPTFEVIILIVGIINGNVTSKRER